MGERDHRSGLKAIIDSDGKRITNGRSRNRDRLDLQAIGDGRDCVLTPGDMIAGNDLRVTDGGRMSVVVLSTKLGACPTQSKALVGVAALQEMDNQFRRRADAGLTELANKGWWTSNCRRRYALNIARAGLQGPRDSNLEGELRQNDVGADKAEAPILRAFYGGK